ncbi:MAG: NAD-dependent epimerase/dehydratase family protein [Nitrolancea sp.]
MKVLVTGGAGFIGSHTVDLLLEHGYDVRIVDALLPPVHRAETIPSYVPRDAEFIHGNLLDRTLMERALQGVDYVFHLAAYQDYLTDFSTFFHTNSVGTALLYELVFNKGFPVQKIVVASSQAVYGEGKYSCPVHGNQYPDARPIEQLIAGDWNISCSECGSPLIHETTDESAVRPHNSYAMSKYAQEMISINLGRRYDIPTTALRYSITPGPRQSFQNAYSGILRIFTLNLMHNVQPLVYEDGNQLRDYVYVGDVAKANILALEDKHTDFQVLNVGGPSGTTVIDYARTIADCLNKKLEPQMSGEFRHGDTRHIVSDITRLRTFGWEPSRTPREIAESYIEWVQGQPGIANYGENALNLMRSTRVVRRAVAATA